MLIGSFRLGLDFVLPMNGIPANGIELDWILLASFSFGLAPKPSAASSLVGCLFFLVFFWQILTIFFMKIDAIKGVSM